MTLKTSRQPHPISTTPAVMNRRTALAAMAGSLATLTGCGGGATSMAGVSSGGTGSFTTGTISGLGSILVNGIRWDDRAAQRLRRDGDADDGTVLQLGRVVDIVGTRPLAAAAAGALPTATATTIRWGGEWVGPIDAGSRNATGFTVLRHPVQVTATTIVDGTAARLEDLADGDVVEVDGHLDLSVVPARLLATRIERLSRAPSAWHLSGTVTARDTGTGIFSLGGDLFACSPATELPSAWGVSTVVGVRLGTTGTAPHAAQRVVERLSPSRALGIEDDDGTELEGLVTAWTGPASFAVSGVPVNASAVTKLPAGLALGVRVEVEGPLVGGVVQARSVSLHREDALRDEGFELHGTVTGLNRLAGRFDLQRPRGTSLPVQFDPSTVFEPAGATLADGQTVELKAVRRNGAWWATRVEVESADENDGDDTD